MRTFRLIEMTLLMVLCAVNFTACSDELVAMTKMNPILPLLVHG